MTPFSLSLKLTASSYGLLPTAAGAKSSSSSPLLSDLDRLARGRDNGGGGEEMTAETAMG